MKPNQKSVRGGIQDVLFPMTTANVTQGDFEGNHPWYASDLAGADRGRDVLYAPFDVICKATNPNDGNAVWWQSVNKVRFADGAIDFATTMVIHDNNLSGIHVGVTYKQGQQIAQEGTAGYATGNHIHFEIAKGAFTKQYAKNAKGYYLPNGVAIETACFIDDTALIGTCADWEWKHTSDVPVTSTGTLKGAAIKFWTVDPGDTLSGIAAEMGQTVDALAKHNSIANPSLINIGQVIYNPGYKG